METGIRVLVGSDDETLGQSVRRVLLRCGLECPDASLVPLELATDRASRLAPAIFILVTPPDPRKALAVLGELRQIISTHVLAVGPAVDPKVILQTMHDGADEYLDVAHLTDELLRAVTRFKSRKAGTNVQQEESCRVISVLAPSGGSGSSIVASNLASMLAKQHGSCGLMDLRLSAGDLASLLNLNPSYTVADLCDNLTRIDREKFTEFFASHPSGIQLLAAPKNFSDAPKVTAKRLRHILSLARTRFPYVVADLENAFDEEQIAFLWKSDIMLVVLRLDYTSLRNTRRMIERFTELGLGVDRVRLVVNRHGERKQLELGQAEEALGLKIQHYIPNDPSRVNRAVNAGIPVVLHRPSARISKRIAELAVSVNGRQLQTQAKLSSTP